MISTIIHHSNDPFNEIYLIIIIIIIIEPFGTFWGQQHLLLNHHHLHSHVIYSPF